MATIPAPPKPAAHHKYRSWSTSWYDDAGQRHTKRFGKVNEVTRAVATAQYKRWLADLNVKAAIRNQYGEYLVSALCAQYAEHAKTLYRKNNKLTTHIPQVEGALNALMAAHGNDPVEAIGSPEITRLVDSMIHTTDRRGEPRILSVSTINGRLRIIKQAFRWARVQGLISREAAIDVSLTTPLRQGRTKALSPKRVMPVPDDVIDGTIKECSVTVANMIRLQVLTGMRPGELCGMRPCDIETTGDAWLYRPSTHKSEHHGKSRVVAIGPMGQKILEPYLALRNDKEPVFMASDSHRERLIMCGIRPAIAEEMSRTVYKHKRPFNKDTYYGAVQRACDHAFDRDGKKRANRDYSHRWHPHQLRHNFATRIRREFGIEAVADMLGHSNVSTAEIYAERSIEKTKEFAKKAG